MLDPRRTLLVLALGASALGCASADPRPTVEATADLLEQRGVRGVEWRRDEAAVDRARREAGEILSGALTPAAAGRLALLASPELQATLAELGIAQAELAQATRLANPGVAFSFLEGDGATERTAGLVADVVDWLTQPLRRSLGEAELERAKLQVAAALFDSVNAAEAALVELQAAEAGAGAYAGREEAARVAAEYAKALHEAGNLTLRDRALVEASWAEARVDLEARRGEVERARERLRRHLGLDGREHLQTASLSMPPPLPMSSSESLQEDAVRDRLDVAAARWSIDALERARKLHRVTRWLPVGVTVGVERRSEDGVRLSGPVVELALPIFDTGGAVQASYAAEINRAWAQLEGLEIRVRSEVREALAAASAAAARVEILHEDLVPLRRRALELGVRESNQMLIGAFELLAGRDALLEAEMLLLEATADAWRARIELVRALGRTIEAPPVSAPSTHSEEIDHDHAS